MYIMYMCPGSINNAAFLETPFTNFGQLMHTFISRRLSSSWRSSSSKGQSSHCHSSTFNPNYSKFPVLNSLPSSILKKLEILWPIIPNAYKLPPPKKKIACLWLGFGGLVSPFSFLKGLEAKMGSGWYC